MEQLYRLKEEVKKYYTSMDVDFKRTLEEWNYLHVSMEALEEVSQRVELVISESANNLMMIKYPYTPFTEPERLLMQQTLNGELFTEQDMLNYGKFCRFHGGDWCTENLKEWLKTRKG